MRSPELETVVLSDGARRWLVLAVATAAPPSLTPAERDVARRAVRGDTSAAIAAARVVSVRTVANQLASVYRKLGVASRAELAHALGGGR